MHEDHEDFTRLATGFSRIERRHKRFMNRVLAERGVTGISYSCIIAIEKNPGISQDRLAELQGVDKSRAARMVRRLELDGYVSREPHPGDRRRYMLSLTPKGKELFALIATISRQWAALVSGDIDGADIATMLTTIDNIIRNIDSQGWR